LRRGIRQARHGPGRRGWRGRTGCAGVVGTARGGGLRGALWRGLRLRKFSIRIIRGGAGKRAKRRLAPAAKMVEKKLPH